MRLYWHPLSIVPRRVRIAVREKGIACEEVEVDLPRGAHREPAFLRLNPFAQVPVLEDGDLVIGESCAILEYLEELHSSPPLLPADPARRAVVRQLMLWAGDYIAPAWEVWMAPRFGRGVDRADPSVSRARDQIAYHLDVLERRLGSSGDWLVGDYSLADVCYAPVVTVLGLVELGDLLEERPALRRWVQRLNERPPVRDTAPFPRR